MGCSILVIGSYALSQTGIGHAPKKIKDPKDCFTNIKMAVTFSSSMVNMTRVVGDHMKFTK